MVKDVLFALFIMAELMDAFLTFWGVTRFGLAAEANPLLFGLMTFYGVIPVLIGKFCGSVALCLGIYAFDDRTRWLIVLNVCMWLFAVLPWLYIYYVVR